MKAIKMCKKGAKNTYEPSKMVRRISDRVQRLNERKITKLFSRSIVDEMVQVK